MPHIIKIKVGTRTVFTLERVGAYLHSANFHGYIFPPVSSDGYISFWPDRYLHIHSFRFENTENMFSNMKFTYVYKITCNFSDEAMHIYLHISFIVPIFAYQISWLHFPSDFFSRLHIQLVPTRSRVKTVG